MNAHTPPPLHVLAARENAAAAKAWRDPNPDKAEDMRHHSAMLRQARVKADAYMARRIAYLLSTGAWTIQELCAYFGTTETQPMRVLEALRKDGLVGRSYDARNGWSYHALRHHREIARNSAAAIDRALTTRKPSEAISAPAGEAHGAKEAAS